MYTVQENEPLNSFSKQFEEPSKRKILSKAFREFFFSFFIECKRKKNFICDEKEIVDSLNKKE